MVFTPLQSLFGGAILGGISSCNAVLNGRVTGISGFLHGMVTSSPDWRWRALFAGGLLTGGAAWGQVAPENVPVYHGEDENMAIVRALAAGLTLGVGAAWGNGCTSGHGICGLARFSPRSLFHVLTFIGIGSITTKLTHTVDALQPRTRADAEAAAAAGAPATYRQVALPSMCDLGLMSGVAASAAFSAALLVYGARLPLKLKPATTSALTAVVETNKVSSRVSHASAYISGLVFAGGLGLAGMTDPMKVAAFLDIGEVR